MKKITRILATVLLAVFALTTLIACDGQNSIYKSLYENYCQYAESADMETITYSEWEAAAKSVETDKITILSAEVELDEANNVWVITFTMSDGTTKTKQILATAKSGTDDGGDDTPTTQNDGTSIASAYTIAEATEVAKSLADGSFSNSQVYVKGYITSSPSYDEKHSSYTFYMDDTAGGAQSFQAYSVQLGTFNSVSQGDFVTIYGYLKNHVYTSDSSHVYEIAYNNTASASPTVVASNAQETPTPTPTPTPSTQNDGTSIASAYTIAEATLLAKALSAGSFSSSQVYVTGYITSAPSYDEKHSSYTFYMDDTADGAQSFQAYSVQVGNYTISKGDKVTIYGYLKNHKASSSNVYEIAYNSSASASPTVVASNAQETPTPTPTPTPTTQNDGTSIATAYTIAEATEVAKSLADRSFSDSQVYVKGYITSAPSYDEKHSSYTFYMDDTAGGAQSFQAYSVQLGTFNSVSQGDFVTIYGYLKNHVYISDSSHVYEIAYNSSASVSPTIVAKNGSSQADVPTHTHQYLSYFTYSTCTVSGCTEVGRKALDPTFQNSIKYSLTSAKVDSYKEIFEDLHTNIASLTTDSYIENLEDFIDGFFEVGGQQYNAYLIYAISGSTTDEANNTQCEQWYNELYADIYVLVNDVNNCTNSELKTQFFNVMTEYGFGTQESLTTEAATKSDSTLQNEITAILSQYYNLDSEATDYITNVATLYEQFVAKSNQYAVAEGYSNYMEYAYENEYSRAYTPEQTKTIQQYLKTYIKPIFEEYINDSTNPYVNQRFSISDEDNENFYYGLISDDIFADSNSDYFSTCKQTLSLISQYITSNGFGDDLETMFEKGYYFLGETDGAFTYYVIDSTTNQYVPYVYFQEDSDYSNAFTFVHEFGHYQDFIQIGQSDMDLAETHSQGNEMLFLAWLKNNLPSGITDGYTSLVKYNLTNMLSTILMSAAVDEFEYAVYTNTYSDETYNGKIGASNYQSLFEAIMAEYGLDDLFNTQYWSYVVFDQACYYISYSISALASIEIYAQATTDYSTAKANYLSLFDYSNETYVQLLEKCGISSPFTEDFYKSIQSALAK